MRDSGTSLFGRERELRVVEQLLDDVRDRGSALLIKGDAGVGKTSILDAAKSSAERRGMSVLTATGVQSETNIPFTGLYELLRPVLDRAERLPGPQQRALQAAFGLTEASSADLFLIALGALDLLVDFASERPLLLIVDDAHWLDQSSMNVLAFVARRLQSEPICLLAASRDLPQVGDIEGLDQLDVKALDDIAARALLNAQNPELSHEIRERVLSESSGNPLALVELPKVVSTAIPEGTLPAPYLPLTTRLERSFASRISGLPLITRRLLLVAAMDDRPDLAEVISAARLLSGADVTLDALTPAVSAGLLYDDSVEVRFRHSLVRSAIYGASSVAERVAAHAALADVLKDDPDRRVWHQAAATLGLDDAAAEGLEAAASRALRRGDVRVAIQALDRAAQLSADVTRRVRCLLQAAELAFEIGWPEVAVDLLQKANAFELQRRDRVRLTWFREAASPTISGAQALSEIADGIKNEDDVDLALDILSGPATKGWWMEPDEQVCNHVISAVESIQRSSEDDPRFLLIVAMTSPIDRGAFVIERLARLSPDLHGDARLAEILGLIATQVGDFEQARRFFTTAAAGFRREGRLALLADVLVLRAWSAIYTGNRDTAISDAEEGGRLAAETKRPIYFALARAAAAMLAAIRGDYEDADRLAAEGEREAMPMRTLPAEVQMARGMNALAAGRFDDAYRHLHRMFDPNDSAYHPMRHCYVVGDLVEAAIHSGHRDEAVALVTEMETLAQVTPSPQFHAALQHARALLAQDDDAEALFETALTSEVLRSPFTRARLRLAYGEWLRRARRTKEARALLQAATEAFDALGALPWSERGRQELRAAGVTIERREPELREQLTPQELQIALMAGEGLSNREIGQKLYLSHRTVGSHLYRIFPKLEITSRHQLRDALHQPVEKASVT